MSLMPLPPGHPAQMGGLWGGPVYNPYGGVFATGGRGPNQPEDTRFGPAPRIPESALPWQNKVAHAAGGLFGANSPDQQALFGVDPQEAKRRAWMAAGAQMLAASGPSTTKKSAGQILGESYLAGQKANDEYAQDAQRRGYMAQLAQQQQQQLEQQKRAMMLEQQRSKMMAGRQFNPEALEAAAAELYAAGDVAGAEGALEQAMKLRNYQVDAKNADTNAMIAQRGLNDPKVMQGQDGFYRVNPDGTMSKVANWPQFNPNTGGAGKAEPLPEAEAAIVKQQLAGQLSSLINWAESDGGKALGSPKLGAAWDATVGRAFGTEDYQARRAMGMITGRQLLDMAKYLKPMSNTDIQFLERTMPLQDDAPELWAKWMREYAKRAQIDLQGQGSVYDKYNLERPEGARPGASRSW